MRQFPCQPRRTRRSHSLHPDLWQRNFCSASPVLSPKDAYNVGQRSSGEAHGVVLTRHHIVSLILTLAGYSDEENLGALTLLEPSCGDGAFLVEAARRLVASAVLHGVPWSELHGCIQAFEIDEGAGARSRKLTDGSQSRKGFLLAERLSSSWRSWINQGDFLPRAHRPEV